MSKAIRDYSHCVKCGQRPPIFGRRPIYVAHTDQLSFYCHWCKYLWFRPGLDEIKSQAPK